MKLPHEIQALVKFKSESSTSKFSEESMAKARAALNNLIGKAWVEFDDKIIACKEYQVMNRATFDQVVTDIARLMVQLTDLERIETESMEGIAKMEAEIKAVEDEVATWYAGAGVPHCEPCNLRSDRHGHCRVDGAAH